MRRNVFKKFLAGVLSVAMILPFFPTVAQAETTDGKIQIQNISGKSANANGVELAIDGKKDTFWQSIPSDGQGSAYKLMYAHNRYLDIALDGTYDISQIKIFNKTDNSFNNYYIYASADGVNYEKIAAKTSDAVATTEGDTYEVDTRAAYLRLNMAYNSNAYVTNLAEIEVYGTKTGEVPENTSEIQVEDWEGSQWQQEWDRFESDTAYAQSKVITEMQELVGRVIGQEWKDDFQFEFRGTLQDEKEIFEVLDGENGKILIRGNNGIAMASGFNYYIRHYLNVDYNPMWASNVEVKVENLVPVEDRIIKEAQYNLRYALNFCTYSYTMAFWNWDEYEEFLDWAAMNGLNLILDIVGQEEVLRQTFLEYNFTLEEIKDYICGPAYFAWFYMQNLYSVGGPLPDAWFEQRAELGRKIHDRMQTFGITPVLQGFSGQVPETFPQKNSGAQMAPQDVWTEHTRPSLLMTYVNQGQTDYFKQVAETFYEKQKNVFGDISDYYATDPFHEGGNTGGLAISTVYKVVQEEMIKSNPEAVWVIQQWQNGLTANKVSEIQPKHTLVLDLQSDMRQQHGLFEQNGTPWIYCMLHNFGGRMGLDGEVPVMATDPMETYNRSNHMVGIGITPEALENSPVIYELFFDTLWTKEPIDYEQWMDDYARRRAGGENEEIQKAWDILLETAYADKGVYFQGAAETVINSRPADTITSASTWGHNGIYYEKDKLDEALRLLAENYEVFQSSEAYKYDLADVAEQVLCNVASEYHARMVTAKNEKNLADFQKYSTKFLEIIDLSDKILSTSEEFMVGTWIEASRKMITGADDWTKDLFEFNARCLITTWGGERPSVNGRLKDYSNRKWAGLTEDFYKERWEIWIRNRTAELTGSVKNPEDQKAESNWFLWEFQWANRKSDDENGAYGFDTVPSNEDLGALATEVYEKYSYTALVKSDGETQGKINALKGKAVVLTAGTTQNGNLQNVTDGDTGNEWVGTGTSVHVLEIDLEGTYQLDEFLISVPQFAKNYPYTYKLETYNPQKAQWEEVDVYTEGQLGSNTTIAKGESFVAEKVRLTIQTSDAVNDPVTITDLAAYGKTLNTVEYVNLAKGITPQISVSTASDSNAANLTDGNTSSLWKTPWPYNDGYPADIVLELPEEKYVEYIQIYFETEGRPFQFVVEAEDGQGNKVVTYEEYKDHTTTLSSSNYKIPVKQDAKKVKMSFVGSSQQGTYGASTPAMTEIMVMGVGGEKQPEPVFQEGKITGITVSGGGADGTLVDGNKGNYKVVEKNQEISFRLPAVHYVKNVDITFEKWELGLKYQVLLEDHMGNRTMVLDKSRETGLLRPEGGTQQATISVPVNDMAERIIFIHMGNNGNGPAYGAQSRVYEVEIFGGIPDSITSGMTVDVEGAEAILDHSTSTTYQTKAGDVLEIQLDQPADVNLICVQKKEGTQGIVKFKAEYYEEENQTWRIFTDRTQQEKQDNIIYGMPEEVIRTQKIRLTFPEVLEVAEVKIYVEDYNGQVVEKINEIRSQVSQLNYNGENGSYRTEAKEVLEATLIAKEQELTRRLDSVEAALLLEELEVAYKVFQKIGKLHLNRGVLLLQLSEANILLEKAQEDDGEFVADLQKAYEESLTLYNTYRVTQSNLDTQAETLANAIAAYKENVPPTQEPEGNKITINWNMEPEMQEMFSGTGEYLPGELVQLSAIYIPHYQFLGWYLGEEKVSDLSVYFHVIKESDINQTFVAKYEELPKVTIKWKSNPEFLGVETDSREYYIDSNVLLEAEMLEDYVFLGWYLEEKKVSNYLSFTYKMKHDNGDKTFIAKYREKTKTHVYWESDPVNIGMNSGDKIYTEGESVNLNASRIDGYRFLGWYLNGRLVSDRPQYTYVVESEDKDCTFVAKYQKLYVINWKSDPIDTGVQLGSGNYAAGETVELKAEEVDNYAFRGWYDGENCISTSFVFNYQVKDVDNNKTFIAKYREKTKTHVYWESDPVNVGMNSGNRIYTEGESVNLTADEINGYKFLGWYLDGVLVSDSSQYTYVVEQGDEDCTFVAKYQKFYVINWKSEPVENGITPGSSDYAPGEIVELTAEPVESYDFLGWYEGESCLGTELSFQYEIKENDTNKTFVAKYQKKEEQVPPEDDNNQGEPEDGGNQNENGSQGGTEDGGNQNENGGQSGTEDGGNQNENGSQSGTGNDESQTAVQEREEAKNALNHAITSASGLKASAYEKNSYEVFEKVLQEVKSVFANPNATKEELMEANKKLQEAQSLLKLAVVEEEKEVFKPGKPFAAGIYQYQIKNDKEAVFTGVKTSIKTVKIANTVKYQGKTLKVTSIANGALKGDKVVTTVKVGKNVTIIGKSAFENCSKLKSIALGSKTAKIGAKALKGCKSLTKVTIPKNVTIIEKSAFAGCSKLSNITIQSSKLKTVQKKVFQGIKKTAKIKVPKKNLAKYKKLLKNKGQNKKVSIK